MTVPQLRTASVTTMFKQAVANIQAKIRMASLPVIRQQDIWRRFATSGTILPSVYYFGIANLPRNRNLRGRVELWRCGTL